MPDVDAPCPSHSEATVFDQPYSLGSIEAYQGNGHGPVWSGTLRNRP
jgi:hypothetical protein